MGDHEDYKRLTEREQEIYDDLCREQEITGTNWFLDLMNYIKREKLFRNARKIKKLNKRKMSQNKTSKKSRGGRRGANARPKKLPGQVSNRRIKQTARLNGHTTVHAPKGARFVGFGDYTEAKGRAMYDKKKAKKRTRKANGGGKHDWWDTAGKAAGFLGKVAPLLMGFGDYDVDTNSVAAAATNGKIGGDIPLMTNSHCANIIHHREYIGAVHGSMAAFTPVTYPLNPGLSETFPWLAPIAGCYTRYRWRGVVVEYVPLACNFSTTGLLGYVALATQYNPLDPEFTDKRNMLNHEFSTEVKISELGVHPIECAKNQMSIDEYFIRDAPPPQNADIRFYDIGELTVATGANPSNDQIGDLWITYEVEFYQPKLNLASTDSYFIQQRSGAGQNASGFWPFGNAIVTSNDSTLGSVTNDGRYFVFDKSLQTGDYMVTWINNGDLQAVFNAVGTPVLVFGGNLLQDYGIAPQNAATLVTHTSQTVLIRITSKGCYLEPAQFGYPNGTVIIIIQKVADVSTLLTQPDVPRPIFIPDGEKTIEPSESDSDSDSFDPEEEMRLLQRRLDRMMAKKKST